MLTDMQIGAVRVGTKLKVSDGKRDFVGTVVRFSPTSFGLKEVETDYVVMWYEIRDKRLSVVEVAAAACSIEHAAAAT